MVNEHWDQAIHSTATMGSVVAWLVGLRDCGVIHALQFLGVAVAVGSVWRGRIKEIRDDVVFRRPTCRSFRILPRCKMASRRVSEEGWDCA
jgi:hypothetical protein